MGFYGTLTSSAKTNLQIDKRYSNRADMDKNARLGDGVYAGRYVLVEYSESKSLSDFPLLYEQNGLFYSAPNASANQQITEFVEGEIYKVIPYADWNKTIVPATYTYIMYVAAKVENKITLIRATSASDKTGFTSNFLIDQAAYAPNNSAFKGYDSTIWQKVYDNGEPTYINIAELNSVIPSFGIKVDAPTEKPQAPHFDQNNTNIYYDIHLQPSWGFRVAAANAIKGTTTNDLNGGWDKTHDDEATNQAIYYNKAGFSETNRTVDTKTENFINLDATGISGYEYNISEIVGENKKGKKEDIQEFRLSLPAIGNMVASGWDVIHGINRDDDPSTSLQGRVNFFKNELNTNEIPVQSTGKYLIGATMSDDDWIATKIDATNKNISITHTFTPKEDTTSWSSKNGTAKPSSGAATINNDRLHLYTPIVDARGHVVGKNTETVELPFGFKTITPGSSSTAVTNGTENTTSIIADNTQDILTISPSNKWINVAGNNSSDTLSIGHEVNKINTDKKSSTNLDGVGSFVVQDLIFDEAGHVTANQTHEYTLPNSFRNINIGTASTAITAGASTSATIEADTYNDTLAINSANRWITLNGAAGTDTFSIGHAAAGNQAKTAGEETAITSPVFGSSFNTTIVKYDEMGHISGTGVRSVTFPIGSFNNPTPTGTTSNVLTSFEYVPTSGAITVNNRNLSSLLLTGYGAVKTDSTYVQATDSLTQGIQKIENRLDSTNKRIDDILDGITEEELNTFKELSDALGDDANFAANVNKAIAANTNLINEEKNRAQQAETINAQAIVTEQTRAESQEQAIRAEFAAADKTIGEAIAAVSGLVGETSVSEQIDTKLTNYVTTNSLTLTLGDYYTKDEVNTELANYSTSAVIAENYYNKTDVDTFLQDYAKAEQIPTDFYSKAEVDNLISGLQAQIEELKALIESYHSTTEDSASEEETPTE